MFWFSGIVKIILLFIGFTRYLYKKYTFNPQSLKWEKISLLSFNRKMFGF